MAFKTYKLSNTELEKIARLCVQEQGCIAGAKAEASQGANLLETNATYRNKFGSDIYTFFRTSGWYYRAAYFMDNGHATDAAIDAVKEVLVEGRRVFPQYVDEHDCISDISWAKNGSDYINKNDKSAYVKGKTIIKNVMGSTYTFYAFPAAGCDPFGYTQSAYDYVMKNGSLTAPVSTPSTPGFDMLSVTTSLPELYKGCPDHNAVKLWRWFLGMKSTLTSYNTGVIGKTKTWQTEHGLKADGIVGKKTWAKAFETLK